jgi:hypothetical protein
MYSAIKIISKYFYSHSAGNVYKCEELFNTKNKTKLIRRCEFMKLLFGKLALLVSLSLYIYFLSFLFSSRMHIFTYFICYLSLHCNSVYENKLLSLPAVCRVPLATWALARCHLFAICGLPATYLSCRHHRSVVHYSEGADPPIGTGGPKSTDAPEPSKPSPSVVGVGELPYCLFSFNIFFYQLIQLYYKGSSRFENNEVKW